MKRIYIAGKVTGEPLRECTGKFGRAQKDLEELGFEAVNPLQVVGTWEITWKNAMRKCIRALMECDAIYVLPCSQNSRGAGIELQLAASLGIPLYVRLQSLKNESSKTVKQ